MTQLKTLIVTIKHNNNSQSEKAPICSADKYNMLIMPAISLLESGTECKSS